ncbi:hypothetical protein AAMO2058_000316200 [Amorphochlora amoebiformis]
MFSNKRRVDMGGGQRLNRKKLLEDKRKLRAQRLQKQKEHDSALKIQAYYRSHRNLSRVRREVREVWSRDVLKVLKNPKLMDIPIVMRLVREFIFFFSWRLDVKRLSTISKLLYFCMTKQPLKTNYLGALADRQVFPLWVVQASKLVNILLEYLRKGMTGNPVAALLYLVDIKKSAILSNTPRPVVQQIFRNYVIWIKKIANPNTSFYSSINQSFLHLTTSSPPTSPPPPQSRIAVAALLTIVTEPLNIWPKQPNTTKDSKQLEQKRSANLVSADRFRRNYAENILGVPLIVSRLSGLGLGALGNKCLAWENVLGVVVKAIGGMEKGGQGGLSKMVVAEIEGKERSPLALWIVGNLLEIVVPRLQSLKLLEKAEFFGAIEKLLASVNEIPSNLPIGLKIQLGNIEKKSFLDGMSACVKGLEPAKCHVIYKLCLSLAFKYTDSKRREMLNAIVFSSDIIVAIYKSLQQARIHSLPIDSWDQDIREMFGLFCMCYNHLLLIQDDAEFFEQQKPCTLKEIHGIVLILRDMLQKLYWEGTRRLDLKNLPTEWIQLRKVATSLFRQLRVRQSRRQFCPAESWIMKGIGFHLFKQEVFEEKVSFYPRAKLILKEIPFTLTFEQRVDLLYAFIRDDRKGLNVAGSLMISVRRDRVLENGFEQLYKVGSAIKRRIQVQFRNELGLIEAGIDGGGLFREFITELLRAAFDPQLGLFQQTPHQFTYPNPSSYANPNFRDHMAYFRFVGMIVGKCLYDGIILEPQFANFFLRKLLGYRNFVDDLSTLDPDIYKNLLFLKKNSANGLGLTFSVTRNVFGNPQLVDLVPNGSKTEVNDQNRFKFIYEMADFKLNREIAQQSKAFVEGLHSVINREWLLMFEAEELDRLISGTPVIDLADLRRNTSYAGGYDKNHELIEWFWDILDQDFDEKDRRAFLKFATSVSRSPLLGFEHLNPKFCIQQSGSDTESLPTSSTCMNLLRIPRYRSRQKLKEKLLYSMKSAAGFYLT